MNRIGMTEESTRLVSGKALFVRNLPYRTSDGELESAFCKYGSLKSCFTVKEKGVVDQCRGFGYVTFATREDAEHAKSMVKVIGGRPVQVSFATRKPPRKRKKKERQEGGREADAARKPPREGKRKGTEKEEACEVDDTLRSDGEGGEEESEDDYETRTAKAAGGSVKGHRKPRSQRGEARFDVGRTVVLTNLPENASEKGLRKKCMKVGTVENIQFPVPNRDVSTAFVTFESYKDVRYAVEALNGVTHRGTTLKAVLLSREIKQVSRETLRKSRLIVRNLSFQCSEGELRTLFSAFGEVVEVHIPRKPNGHMLGYAFVQFTSYFNAKKALEGMNAKKIRGRPVAVDWVVPKEKYEQSLEGKTTDREGRGVQGGGGEDGREESDGSSDQSLVERKEKLEMESDDSDSAGSGEESDSSDSEDGEFSEEEEEEEEYGRKNFKEDVHEGKTIFVRNVPVDVDEDELRQAFVQFGGVRYCRLVNDPNTGISRGSAFVQFYDHTAAHHCLEAANVGSQQGLHLHGRQLDISLALSKQDTERLKEQKSNRREKMDKRNLHLAREGVILPDSEAAKDLSKADIAKRMKAYREKKAKLANPNFFVSKTRLSVRNLPTQLNEKQLKTLFLKAAGGPPAVIKQVKILRSTERVDGKGVARSKGFAFVEFSSHEAALTALRATNNNPELLATKKRLIVEFALEDSRALKLREQRHKRQLVSKKSPGSGGKPETKSKEDGGFSRKEKWQLKQQAQRLRKKQRRESQSEQESSLKNMSPLSSQLGVRTALDSDAGTTRTTEVRCKSSVGTKRKAGHQERPEFAANKRQRTSDDISQIRNQQPAARRRMNPKKMKSRKAEDKEEAEFAQMVAKYKRKLLGAASDSRWFE